MQVNGDRVFVSVGTILLATDFSLAAEKAASYAKALARRFSSKVALAHVFDSSIVATYDKPVTDQVINERRQISSENLERLRDNFSSIGIEALTVSLEGHRPASEILRVSKSVDLIVAATQSKPGLEKLILGSTAEQLIRNAECPVLTVGPHAKRIGEGPLAFQSIVYAMDFTPEAAKAAAYALSFAQDSGAHLYFCHVLSNDRSTSAGHSIVDGAFESALKQMVPESSYDWCSPEFVIQHGEAAEAILGLAERVKADLVVLGARKASFWFNHIECGVTSELLARATCPVMTVC